MHELNSWWILDSTKGRIRKSNTILEKTYSRYSTEWLKDTFTDKSRRNMKDIIRSNVSWDDILAI